MVDNWPRSNSSWLRFAQRHESLRSHPGQGRYARASAIARAGHGLALVFFGNNGHVVVMRRRTTDDGRFFDGQVLADFEERVQRLVDKSCCREHIPAQFVGFGARVKRQAAGRFRGVGLGDFLVPCQDQLQPRRMTVDQRPKRERAAWASRGLSLSNCRFKISLK